MFDAFDVQRCLVIAPKNVAVNVWAQECEKWDHLNGLRCSVIVGTEKQRKKALGAKADLYIINRENVVWLMEQLRGDLQRFQMVILDELSSFKSHRAKRWKAIAKAIQRVPYVIGLTGTPAPNGYLDLWSQIYLLDGGSRLGKRIGQYRERYFKPGAYRGHIVYQWLPRLGAQDMIDRSLADLCLSIASIPGPPVIYNEVPVSMSPKARKVYDQLKKEKIIPLLQEAGGFQALNPRNPDELERMTSAIGGDTAAALSGKLLQMANGAVYDDARTVVPIHDAKLDALAEIAEANEGESLLVFYSYQHDRDRILARFPQAKMFSGPQDVLDWNAGKIPMLLCHPASTGHGLNLQFGGHITIWFGLTWSLELYQQANARLARPGQKHSVVIHHIICRDTLDPHVMASLADKGVTQEKLLNALKGYLKGE